MTVAGGRGSKSGELPIFVTSVQPHGCLSRDGRIKRGETTIAMPKFSLIIKTRHQKLERPLLPLSFRWHPAEHKRAGLDVPEPQWGRGHPEGQRRIALGSAAGAGGQHGGRAWPRRAAASHARQWLWCKLVSIMGHVAGITKVSTQRRGRMMEGQIEQLVVLHFIIYVCVVWVLLWLISYSVESCWKALPLFCTSASKSFDNMNCTVRTCYLKLSQHVILTGCSFPIFS